VQPPLPKNHSKSLIYETPNHSPQTRTHRKLLHPVRDASLGNTEQRHNNPCIPLGMQPSQTHNNDIMNNIYLNHSTKNGTHSAGMRTFISTIFLPSEASLSGCEQTRRIKYPYKITLLTLCKPQ